MELYWYVAFFVLGTIIGSFLNVVLYRLHTGRSLNGRSHCMTCGKALSSYELVPIVSYLFQRGNCLGCGARIPPRYLLVELLTGLTFVWVGHLFSGDRVLLVLHLALSALLILIVVYDIRHTIIPDELTLMVGALAVGFLVRDWTLSPDVTQIAFRVLAGLGAALFFYGLWHVSKGRWIGLGDAKLAFPLGIMTGADGVFSMIVFSFWIGAVISLAIVAFPHAVNAVHGRFPSLGVAKYRRYFTMKSEVPFAPFLALGFIAVQFLNANTFDITRLFFSP